MSTIRGLRAHADVMWVYRTPAARRELFAAWIKLHDQGPSCLTERERQILTERKLLKVKREA